MQVEWTKLAEKYARSAQYHKEWRESHEALGSLCEYIGSSQMSEALFGHTSMHTLAISQTPVEYPPHPSVPWLKIEPMDDGKIEFKYVDTQIKERQWIRVVHATQAIERFKKVIDQLNWSTSKLP